MLCTALFLFSLKVWYLLILFLWDGYIFLNTHNAGADSINANELAQLPGNTSSYSAEIKGTFTEGNFPIEKELILKEGAQVIFIKNDPSHEKRFYNGKLGQIEMKM